MHVFSFWPALQISAGEAMNQVQKDELQKYQDLAKNGQIVAATTAAMKFMEQEHLVYRLTISCQYVGVHENNRNGMGVDLAHLAELRENIAAMGYVDHGGRICVELDASPQSDKTRRGFMHILRFFCNLFLRKWPMPL